MGVVTLESPIKSLRAAAHSGCSPWGPALSSTPHPQLPQVSSAGSPARTRPHSVRTRGLANAPLWAMELTHASWEGTDLWSGGDRERRGGSTWTGGG